MKSVALLVSAVAIMTAIAVLSGLTMMIGQEAFAARVDDTAKGNGEDVSRAAIGDPGLVPGEAMGHGEVMDAAR